jgi:uncharacterized protein DUF4926
MIRMQEHDHVELTRAVAGHPVGERGAIVSIGDEQALVEFVDDEGRTLDLAELPLDALRRVTARSAA